MSVANSPLSWRTLDLGELDCAPPPPFAPLQYSLMSDDEAEAEEDSRIASLYNFASKRCDDDGKYTGDAQEFSDYVTKLGTDKAIVHGSVFMNKTVARAHFIVMALIDADGEDEPSIAECITLKKGPLKACVADGGDDAAFCLLAALESYVARMEDAASKEKEVAGFDAVLKALWEWEIVAEEPLVAWCNDERGGRHLSVPAGLARTLREGAGAAFLQCTPPPGPACTHMVQPIAEPVAPAPGGSRRAGGGRVSAVSSLGKRAAR